VLDICYSISKACPHDVRWEKVERIKRLLTGGTYSVPPKQVAAKLLEHMLERGRANHRWKRSKSGKSNQAREIQRSGPLGMRRSKHWN
jgi:hypothetical protein